MREPVLWDESYAPGLKTCLFRHIRAQRRRTSLYSSIQHKGSIFPLYNNMVTVEEDSSLDGSASQRTLSLMSQKGPCRRSGN